MFDLLHKSRSGGLTSELLTLGMHPALTGCTLNHLTVPVIISVTLVTNRAIVSCNREDNATIKPLVIELAVLLVIA